MPGFNQPRYMPSSGARRTSPSPMPPLAGQGVDQPHCGEGDHGSERHHPDAFRFVERDRCDRQRNRAEGHAGVGDLARQAFGLQIDPRLGEQHGHQDAVRRDDRSHVLEADRHQHVQPGIGQLDDHRVDADRCPAAPALATQREPAEHRHQIEWSQAEPARTASARWSAFTELALRHPIHHHRQERTDQQTGDDHDHHQQREAHPSAALRGPSGRLANHVHSRSDARIALLKATVDSGASDLHLTVGRPATARRDGVLVSFENVPVLTTEDVDRMVYSLLDDRKLAELERGSARSTSRSVCPTLVDFEPMRSVSAGNLALALACRAVPRSHAGRARCSGGLHDAAQQAVRHRARGGPDRFGQVDDARRDDRPHQRHQAGTHPHHRGPGGVHASTTRRRWSTSARWAPTSGRSTTVCAAPFVRTPTSCCSVRCATSIRSKSRCRSPRPVTSCSPRCTPTTLRRHSTASSTSSHRRDDATRSRSCSPVRCRGSSRSVLMPSIGGGRVAAYEVMVANEAIRNLVREGKSRQMRNIISTGAAEGMQTIEMDLARLVAAGLADQSMETAMEAQRSTPRRCRRSSRPPGRRCTRTPRWRPDRPDRPGPVRTASAGHVAGGAAAARTGAGSNERQLSGQRSSCGRQEEPVQEHRRGHALSWRLVRACPRGCRESPSQPKRRSCCRKLFEVLDFRPTFEAAAINVPMGMVRDAVGAVPAL
jgi:hypothetical protein